MATIAIEPSQPCLARSRSLLVLLVVATTSAAALDGRRRLRPQPGADSATSVLDLSSASSPKPSLSSATVLAEAGQGPSGGDKDAAAELLRFVTAYRTGLEAVTDVTPYAPLLRLAADESEELHFYTFIDTWVGNDTSWDMLYMDNTTGKCYPQRRSHGNGWSVSLDLVLWPQPPSGESAGDDVAPRAVVTLGTGYFGGRYSAGVVDMHEGKLSLAASGAAPVLHVAKSADLMAQGTATGRALAAPPRIFKCERGKEEAELAALLGQGSRGAQQLALLRGKEKGDDEWDRGRKELRSTLMQTLLWPHMEVVEVAEVREEEREVTVRYNTSTVLLKEGMPVYLRPSDVVTDTHMHGSLWWNLTYPFEPAGKVVAIDDGTATLSMEHPCLPVNATKNLPGLLLPKGPGVVPEAEALADGALQHGFAAAGGGGLTGAASGALAGGDDRVEEPLLLEPAGGWGRWYDAVKPLAAASLLHLGRHKPAVDGGRGGGAAGEALQPVPVLARVAGPAGATAESLQQDQDLGAFVAEVASAKTTVCVVSQRRQGNLFQRNFELPELAHGDRVLLQLAVTGHGWAETTASCGEYCHAVYRISLNGASAANVTQWRDDCRDNPIDGKVQMGTWFESRNGWCPGTVEPGVFFDVTPWARAGRNDLSFDLVVWSASADRYEQYTDYGGFALGDEASFVVGMAAFVYDGAVVHTVKRRDAARTASERALREGSSHPEALRPPAHVERPSKEDDPPDSLIADASRDSSGHSRGGKGAAASSGDFDFERRAPWYLYNETIEGPPGAEAGATRLRIFENALVQADTRVIRASVQKSSLTHGWARAALHLRLSQPPDGLEYDHWDRVGSIGLVLRPGAQEAVVQVQRAAPELSATWGLTAAALTAEA